MSRFGLKIVAAMLLLAVIPAATSIWLMGQVIEVTHNVAEGQSRRLADPLKRAADAYRSFFRARKEVFKLQAELLSSDSALQAAATRAGRDVGARERVQTRLETLVQVHDGLGRVRLLDGDDRLLGEARSHRRYTNKSYRELELTRRIGETGQRLEFSFFTPSAPFRHFRALGQARQFSVDFEKLGGDLARFFRVVFLIMFGAVVVVAMAVGLFIARRTTRRLFILLEATREVAAGDLDVKVDLGVRDEIQELADSFNEMVAELKTSRETITYLEKIGAWQEIARRLAHEIKNPLTPIQLAMQQLHRKYEGDDERFSRMLDDANDIVSEEIGGLRRLVTAFSAFAKLPSVQPEPVDLNRLMDDFMKVHAELAERSELHWVPLVAPQQVLVDRMLIKHLLVNLVENAIQAGEEAGRDSRVRIEISAEVERIFVRLEVADDGPGMGKETLRRAFDPYYTTKDHGTGLGLAIVKKIVLEHQGTIDVDSDAGRGTRFTVRLPRPEVPHRTAELRKLIEQRERGETDDVPPEST